jgi:hypothetical protein
VLGDVMAAKDNITFSIYTPVVRTMQDWRISAQGSTAAGREFLALCAAQPALPQQQPAPEQPAPQEPAPQEPAPQQLPPVEPGDSAWTFVPGDQPELIGPPNDGLQLILICVADRVAIPIVESTNIASFPTLRSSSDGLLILGLDEAEPVVFEVGPGPARRGVLSAVAENAAAGDAIATLLATPNAAILALLVADVERNTNVMSAHSMAGAAAAAAAFRTACYGP